MAWCVWLEPCDARGPVLTEIESVLFDHNARRCQPPLPGAEVSRIAASVASYPAGGPDPLDAAFQTIEVLSYQSNYERFILLARQLQETRPDQHVALPLERISALMRIHWTTAGLYRPLCRTTLWLDGR
jgi:hypothetical protein